MSYIQCVATTKQVILTSDGRVRDKDNNIIMEDYKKIKRINEKVGIAYAGDREPCETIIKGAEQCLINLNCKDTCTVDQFFEQINNIAHAFMNVHTGSRAQFIIGGIRYNNKLGFMTLSTNNNFATVDKIPNLYHPIEFCCAGSDNLNDEILNVNLQEMYNSESYQENPSTALYKTINKTSRYISTIDDSVNSKIFKEVIWL